MFESLILRMIKLLLVLALGVVVVAAILGALAFYDSRKGHNVD